MILQSIRYGWNKARLWVWAFLPALLLQWLLDGAVTWHGEADGTRSLRLWWHNMGPQTQGIAITATVLGFVAYVVSLWVRMGIIHGSVQAARGENVTASDFFLSWERVWEFVAGTLLYALIVRRWHDPADCPRHYLGASLQYVRIYMVTEGAGPHEALQKSAAATTGTGRAVRSLPCLCRCRHPGRSLSGCRAPVGSSHRRNRLECVFLELSGRQTVRRSSRRSRATESGPEAFTQGAGELELRAGCTELPSKLRMSLTLRQ